MFDYGPCVILATDEQPRCSVKVLAIQLRLEIPPVVCALATALARCMPEVGANGSELRSKTHGPRVMVMPDCCQLRTLVPSDGDHG